MMSRASLVERLLAPFSDVRRDEATTGLLLLLNIFLVLASYYFAKPLREGWLATTDVGGLSQIEVKAYSSFAQGLVLAVFVPAYAWLATHLPRRQLILTTSLFFGLNLVLFWWLHPDRDGATVPQLGLIFYVWVGIFGVALPAQFWSFAADLYNEERGRRLFPLIAIGASAGAAVGAWLAGRLVGLPAIESEDLLLVSLVPLLLALVLTLIVDRRGQTGRERDSERRKSPAAPGRGGAYRLIFRQRYLLLAALLVLLINWVNTSGENILFGIVQKSLAERAQAAGIVDPAAIHDFTGEQTTRFYGDLYSWVNALGLLLQAFVASRLLRWGGFTAIILITPLVSLMSYAFMALVPALAVVRVMKIAENASNYSLNNTARHLLWLPVHPSAIYKAKTAVDTLFARSGDALAALTVLVSARVVALSLQQQLWVNLALVGAWALIAWRLAAENRRLASREGTQPAPTG